MKKIRIEINQAILLSYKVELNENLPHVTAEIGLYANQTKISTFSLSTYTWQDASFTLPITIIPKIKAIAKELENILIRTCSNSIGMLEAPK